MPKTAPGFLQRTWVRRAVPVGAAIVLVIGGTVVARTNANASPIDTYRTTAVTKGSVEQRLDLTGSVRRVNQLDQSFAVAGTVSGVLVSVGDTVTAGQVLATLDPAPLTSAVTAATATLAQAKAILESDQTASTTTSSATSATPSQTATTTGSRSASPSVRSGADPSLVQAQEDMTSAQSAVTADLGAASVALARCAPFFPSESSGPTASPTGSSTSAPTTAATTTATTPPSTTTTTTPPDPAIKACIAALTTAPTQQQIARDQQALARSQADLIAAVTLAITTAGNTANTAITASPTGSTGQSSAGRTGAAIQSNAARAVSDQAAITNAATALNNAQTDLASATLESSIAGTVGSVGLVNGVSSQGKKIVIVGAGAVEVTVNVPLSSMATVHVGQKANVTPQGATSSVPSTVTSISLLPLKTATGSGTGPAQATATASSPTYPVVVLVPDPLPALASGSRAEVSLLLGTAANVLTAPNSALTPLGNGQAMAMTFKDGLATQALVKTGYVGMLTTQITFGLTVGQQVVLADLSTALPTNTTNPRRFGVGAGAAGGLGGAGLGGAGLGGGTVSGRGSVTGRGNFTPGG